MPVTLVSYQTLSLLHIQLSDPDTGLNGGHLDWFNFKVKHLQVMKRTCKKI